MDATKLPNRRSIRLRDYDYAQGGAYFVTICTTQRLCLFGDVINGEVALSTIGQVAEGHWEDVPNHALGVTLDVWVLMPNHLHGVVVLPDVKDGCFSADARPYGAKPSSLGVVIGGFKGAVSREVSARNLTLVRPLWQRNYHERIIRNDGKLDAIRTYIHDNPARWLNDPDHPRLRDPRQTAHHL